MSSCFDRIIDFHTHTILSDGALIPAEHVRRAQVNGYGVIGISDHVDSGVMKHVAKKVMKFAKQSQEHFSEIQVIPGVELTHVPPTEIAELTEKARGMGVMCVIVHGETRTEPVAEGTNRAAIEAGVDILAHPGFISEEDMLLAKEKGVHIEITHRKGHSITNGYIAKLALKVGAKLVLDSDTHRPDDFLTEKRRVDALKGAGLDEKQLQMVLNNNKELAEELLAK